ncbi:MAG: tRNA lysidine(34) synthetase TilS [Prevotella stercorea]|uniref:tRNA lysidine(34) synthetase TilS n=1 Tax=Leyella stercorea TaxID=363265 RepID=UPI0025F338CB|nr:tRNA lysidine(34) synthetase TilS [Prevotella sp.]MCI7021771.1 tRNA lysidine(34) synthetase TilS [Prevotella sp.]MDD7212505.1 tRNA lysidine(34) synthetase TilS [Leyella stercorea]MDY4664769.1 tRNA lysidine(34) synthetase TilS [Prevotella sp.]MDY5552358.1 tRNA lysidine(34) synthetase TilS [Prevotella sp.]
MEKSSAIINSFVDRVQRFASVHELFVYGGKYIVALSGGADSVSLLFVLKHLEHELGIGVEAAHCNFHLRGAESVRDEEFCKQLCDRLSVPLHLIHFDTQAYADLHRVSIEMAARDLRYGYFENLRRDIEAQDICVAHHRDDSVETVLLNLVRGTGLRGLRGIQPRNGNIIRPLLSLSREDIVQYLDALGESYVTDSTNLHNDVKRNKIRLDVMPLLRELNPSVSQSIFESSLRVGEALKVFDEAMKRSIADVTATSPSHHLTISPPHHLVISVERLKKQPSPEYTLHEILSSYGFTSAQIEQIYGSLDTCSAGKIIASDSHELAFDRGSLLVQPRTNVADSARSMRIPETGTYVFSDSLKIKVAAEDCGDDYVPSRAADCVCLDASDIKFPLTLRHIEQGDRFVPFGMNGMKLVSDYLTDRKKNVFEKRAQLVVTDAQQRIVWLVGERTDNRFRISKETSKALRLTLLQ